MITLLFEIYQRHLETPEEPIKIFLIYCYFVMTLPCVQHVQILPSMCTGNRMVSRGIWNRFIKISWAVKWWVMFRGFWNIASWYLVHFIQRETMLFLFIQNTISNNMLQRNLPITFQTFLIPWCNLGNSELKFDSISLIWVLKHCGIMLKFYLNGEYMGTQSNETSLQEFNSIIYLQAMLQVKFDFRSKWF